MNVVDIALDHILVGDRLRAVDEAAALLLADSMAADGQHTAIKVRPAGTAGSFHLIAGAHRVRAAQIAGLETLAAVVVAVSEIEAELLEIDENLLRRELSEIDRAFFLMRRKRAYERGYPQTKLGANQHNLGFARSGKPSRFTADAAETLGLSERVIQRAVRRHERLDDAARRLLAGSRWADNGAAIDAVAKLPLGQQLPVVEALLAGARTVALARAAVDGTRAPELSPDERQYQALAVAWSRAGSQARRHFVGLFAADLKKAGSK